MPRDPERIDDVLEAVEEYWRENPHLRLGQIINNMAARRNYTDAFYIEDETLVKTLQEENDS